MAATARNVFDKMGCAWVAMNTHVCNGMLHLCFNARDATLAQELMTRMDAAGVRLDRFSFNIVRDLHQEGNAARGDVRAGVDGLGRRRDRYRYLKHHDPPGV
ncbi:hypothetical protein QYE76_049202 [Lolium multiflorum]|uniref:Uncharacterized protein n=1 Tax=Lolium multiflorum TaxID=4521 RepID=A0AAD8WI46_LOLMU|nr:hypothetical protein QYE76_049202 [Lolium multiflorum]